VGTCHHSTRRFWLGSTLIHVALCALVLASPAGELILGREQPLKPKILRQGGELQAVIAEVRELAIHRLRAQVDLLAAAQLRMALNFDTLNRFHQPFVVQQLEAVRHRFEQAVAEAGRMLAGLHAALVAAQAEPETAMGAFIEVVGQSRARLLVAHDELRRSVLLLAPDDQALVALQIEADELQQEVDKLCQWAISEQQILDQRKEEPLPEHREKRGYCLTQALALQAEAKDRFDRLVSGLQARLDALPGSPAKP
jgi:hypothetical protein